ncbi:Sec23/Sec24 helical domain containing protein, putative [Angomonas deanei]|uniref:Sec23/Sec24 helical domain containing protein, putative n=1 Tax=Angomonas deanei TaxID=59799 RepID=A0A7G2CF26_9TRYP|nr:Sec23/Sec24 helical domain containing protein, putative [Angomonas deanei]
MFLTYRKYAGSSDASDSKILVMPRRLKLLLVLTVCAFKSEALTEGTTVRIDERVSSIYDLLSMPVNKLITYLYPALYEVHRLMDFEVLGTVNPVTGKCVLPPPRQLIPESIIKEGVYLLCDEQARLVYMWIGSLVPPECSQFLFGVDDANMVGRQGGPDESQFHERLTQILYAVTTRDDGIRKLIVLHEKDTMEDSFFKLLKEERDGTLGYSEYMYTIHQMIRNALA